MAPIDGVPVTSSLKDIYGEDLAVETAAARFRSLAVRFSELYGEGPQLISRAPGRVNLIGEHIDYEGYSVLPMAILHDTLVAIRPSTSHTMLKLANMRPEKYPSIEFSAQPDQEVDTSKHHWGNYFLCGYKGVFDHLKGTIAKLYGCEADEQKQVVKMRAGLDVLVDGAVPIGAGLSSSAALVCSAAVGVMAAFDLSFSKEEVADLACRCERYIGTQSGGMDQAISILARTGVAKLIDFNPVRATDVVLPAAACFVIANSLTVSEKAVTAATNYNRRVTECRLAALVLAVKLGTEPKEAVASVQTLGDVEALVVKHAAENGAEEADKGSPAFTVQALLHEEPYTRQEIEEVLQCSLDAVFGSSAASMAVLAAASSFKLQQRAAHVYSEAHRVLGFRDICAAAHAAEPETSSIPRSESSGSEATVDVLRKLGGLMNSSHESCSKLYECSSPELEELVAVARKGGAFGSRLTGAGWGGCTVSLVAYDKADAFVQYLKDNFYAERVRAGVVSEANLATCVFASPPSSGAAIFHVLK